MFGTDHLKDNTDCSYSAQRFWPTSKCLKKMKHPWLPSESFGKGDCTRTEQKCTKKQVTRQSSAADKCFGY